MEAPVCERPFIRQEVTDMMTRRVELRHEV